MDVDRDILIEATRRQLDESLSECMTLPEAAHWLGMSINSARKYLRKKRGVQRVGALWRVPVKILGYPYLSQNNFLSDPAQPYKIELPVCTQNSTGGYLRA